MEQRVLLTATEFDATTDEAEISAQAEATQAEYTSDTEQYVDSSIASFVSDAAYSLSEPDYDAVISSSPISELYSSSPLAETTESLDNNAAQELEAAQESA